MRENDLMMMNSFDFWNLKNFELFFTFLRRM